jgi:putative phosphoribosyl transferase
MGLLTLPTSDLWRDGWAFEDRDDAARRLARMLADVPMDDAIALGLPRGGVPIAARVALELHLPLDVLIVRKLGVPAHPEVAMGAIGEGGVRILDERLVRALGVEAGEIEAVERRERAVLRARVTRLRSGRAPLDLQGRTALILDDGIATGATATAACGVARALGSAHILVAAPVGAPDALARVEGADDVVCLLQPRNFQSVGAYYRNFESTSDDEVAALLAVARRSDSTR